MSDEIYCFSIGRFQCAVVRDGTFTYPQPARFFAANAPQDELATALAAEGIDLAAWHEQVTPYAPLLIRTDAETILVDTGAGALAPTTGRLLPGLQSMGIAPADIDVVVLTHAHPDHIGGALAEDSRPAFAHARYVISQPEWHFWMEACDLASLQVDDPLKGMMHSMTQRALAGVEPRLDRIAMDAAIAPGVTALPAPGHTPGHIALAVESAGETLVELADTVLLPLHVTHPDWVSAVDWDAEQTVVTRRRLVGQAAVARQWVHAYHVPCPGLGNIEMHDGAWQWKAKANVRERSTI